MGRFSLGTRGQYAGGSGAPVDAHQPRTQDYSENEGVILASLERLRALPRLLDIVRTLIHYGLHDLVHSVGLHRVLEEAGHRMG